MYKRSFAPRRPVPAIPKPVSTMDMRDAKESLAGRLEMALNHRPDDVEDIGEMRAQLIKAQFIGYAVTVTISRHYQTRAYAGTSVYVITMYQGVPYVCGSPPFRLVTNAEGRVVREIWTKYGQSSPLSRNPVILHPGINSQWIAPPSEMGGTHRVIFFLGEEGHELALTWAREQLDKQF